MAIERHEEYRRPLYLEDFPFDREALSPEERGVLITLEKAAAGIAPIFARQRREGFYPSGLHDDELMEAAKEDPRLISPYTVVERDTKGDLVAVPYHEKYKDLLEPVAQRLREAAMATSNSHLQEYLKFRAQALLNGDYEHSEAYRLEGALFPIDIVIGPYDVYLDPRNLKFAYQAWTGILEPDETYHLQKVVDLADSSSGPNSSPRMRVRVDQTTRLAGLAAERVWSGNSLPCQAEWQIAYGSLLTIFKPSFAKKFRDKRLPALRTYIDPSLHQNRSDKELYRGALHFLTLHEVSHSKARRKGDHERLGENYAALTEMYCNVWALSTAFEHRMFLKEEAQDVLLGFLGWSIADAPPGRPTPIEKPYVLGDSVVINYSIDRARVLKLENGKLSWDDPLEVARAIKDLGGHINYLLSQGRYGEVRNFFGQYKAPLIGERFHQQQDQSFRDPTPPYFPTPRGTALLTQQP